MKLTMGAVGYLKIVPNYIDQMSFFQISMVVPIINSIAVFNIFETTQEML